MTSVGEETPRRSDKSCNASPNAASNSEHWPEHGPGRIKIAFSVRKNHPNANGRSWPQSTFRIAWYYRVARQTTTPSLPLPGQVFQRRSLPYSSIIALSIHSWSCRLLAASESLYEEYMLNARGPLAAYKELWRSTALSVVKV